MFKIKELYHVVKEYHAEKVRSRHLNIKAFNFWESLDKPESLWLFQFINHNFADIISTRNQVSLFSVFGDRRKIWFNRSPIKIFYTGENVDIYNQYKDHCLREANLSLGFEYLDHSNYLRFPYWLTCFFNPAGDYRSVKETVHALSHYDYKLHNITRKYCSLVSSHGRGVRKQLFNALTQIDEIASGGDFLNNTDIKKLYNDNKWEFIRNYKFNICPENSNKEGYVTEKIFEAINAGCIPVYWGSNNNPEPEVLNKDAILFYSGPESVEKLNATVFELHTNEKLYKEFIAQEKFLPTATEYILDTLCELENKLKGILMNT